MSSETKMLRRGRLIALGVLSTVVLAACGGNGESSVEPIRKSGTASSVTSA